MPAVAEPRALEQAYSVRQGGLFLRWFGLVKVPLIGWVRPRVRVLDEHRLVVRIPLVRRTRNHLGSMYFGALAIGADVAAGAAAMLAIEAKRRASGTQVSLVFKDVEGTFLRRPESGVEFVCDDLPAIRALVDEAAETDQRVERRVPVICLCPETSGDEPVARFVLTLSLKRQAPK